LATPPLRSEWLQRNTCAILIAPNFMAAFLLLWPSAA
jgi:hypothetical protein